jgi:uncharacterized phage protein (TIGR01671 family)
MREILFRGKRVDSGMWIQGYLFQCWGRAYILWGMTNNVPTMHEVIPETVGQFTGLLDKHGRKIFEGDIVVTCPSPLSISDGGDISKRLIVDSWVFTDMCRRAMYRKSSKREKFYKIVGNIHDNPESLGGK